ncbi:flagellar hook-length control protein FliK [Thiohalospira halophila]|uniref:flagellar hook-length control protein FliK n=1 Tax=Thiohalospira halophila TaxID=381300 RepID=UPI001F07BB94|nr:flagellar hook-length control protein FliK [Thiohalospira halophila]
MRGAEGSGKGLPADGSELPEDGNPFADADTDLLKALFGIGKEGAEALTELSAEEGQALLARLQEMLGELDLKGGGGLGEQLAQLLQSGGGKDAEALANLLQSGGGEGERSLQGLLQEIAGSDEGLAAALRGIDGGNDAASIRQTAAALLASAGEGGGQGGSRGGLEALRQRLEGLDLPQSTRQRLEAALQGTEGRAATTEGLDTGRGESRLQAFLRAGLQSLGSNGQGEGERNLALKAMDGEGLMGRQGSLLGTSTGTGSEAGRSGETAAQRVAAMGLGTQAGSGGGFGSGFGGGFGASTGGFGSAFAGTSTAGTIANSPLGASVNGQGWNQAVGERVVFMARNGIQRADVRLHPQNLGPLDIRVSVQNEQASVTFNVQNATTRDAVEQALPRLRELFEQQGMDLVDVDVSDQQQQFAEEGDGRPGSGEHPGHGEVAANEEADGTVVSMTPDEVAARGGVDYYA